MSKLFIAIVIAINVAFICCMFLSCHCTPGKMEEKFLYVTLVAIIYGLVGVGWYLKKEVRNQ